MTNEITLQRGALLCLLSVFVAATAFIGWRASTWSPAQPMGADEVRLRRAISKSPADRFTISRIAEHAFELGGEPAMSEKRWRLAAATLRHIAPAWSGGKVRVVRAGLFHWPELTEEGQKLLRSEAAALIREPAYFQELGLPLYRLTGDIRLVAENAPLEPTTFPRLLKSSLSAGRFEDYRLVRARAPDHFARLREELIRRNASGDEFVRALLSMPLDVRMLPLMSSYLQDLEQKPPQAGLMHPDDLQKFFPWAIIHDLTPLAPLYTAVAEDPSIPRVLAARLALAAGKTAEARLIADEHGSSTRSAEWAPFHFDVAAAALRQEDHRGALAALRNVAESERDSMRGLEIRQGIAALLGEADVAAALARQRFGTYGISTAPARWRGLCEQQRVCDRRASVSFVADSATDLTLAVAASAQQSIAAWVEIRDNGSLLMEGPVSTVTTFRAAVPAGEHFIEVELMNPITGLGGRRSITLRSSSFQQSSSTVDEQQKRPR